MTTKIKSNGDALKKIQDAAKEHLGRIERGEKVARPVFYKLEK